MNTRPDHTEAAEYYFTYMDQVPDGDIRDTLEAQIPETAALARTRARGAATWRSSPPYAPRRLRSSGIFRMKHGAAAG